MAEKKKRAKKVAPAEAGISGNIPLYSVDGSRSGSVQLPPSFFSEPRPDLVHRAVVAAQANRRQPYGPSPTAGMRHSVSTWGKGRGVARVQRLMGSSRAAQSPPNVGGRRAHPPKVARDYGKKVNRKERLRARLAALSAAADPTQVRARGHHIPEDLPVPLVIEDAVEELGGTQEAVQLLEKLGLSEDLQRAKEGTTVRAGHGKMRNRPYRTPRSLLVVLARAGSGARSFANLPGVEVTTPQGLTVEQLAPGGKAGRLLLLSQGALADVGKWVVR